MYFIEGLERAHRKVFMFLRSHQYCCLILFDKLNNSCYLEEANLQPCVTIFLSPLNFVCVVFQQVFFFFNINESVIWQRDFSGYVH